MPEETFVIRDGVRRAKAAWILGHREIWACLEGEQVDRRIPISSLRSTKLVIDPEEKEGQRWANVWSGMIDQPDLMPSIIVIVGEEGVPISEVRMLESES